MGKPPSQVRWLIVDAEAIIHVDYSAARVITGLQSKLKSGGTELGFARMHWGLQSDLARHQLVIDSALIFNRLHEALAAFQNSHTQ